eukprot:TRINITY_DN4855_c1_g1_i1.p1 TRINITY_DN4855_c1_g1~~TRINITY_DN4855_c1_g1_i1.p1  ORF type:complete len:1037 (+),score=177.89 TRINITY_DN4855_c1_g1_i1:83-3112(+)
MEDQQAIYEAKKLVAGEWGKLDIRKRPPQLDKTETYEMEFSSAGSWFCVRNNAEGSRKFKLVYDSKTNYVWWGASYFMDPSELRVKASADKLQWYRANDKAKSRAAFAWKKIGDGPPPPPPKAKSKAQPKASQGGYIEGSAKAGFPGTDSSISSSTKASRLTGAEKTSTQARHGASSVGNNGSRGGSVQRCQPEVMATFRDILIIYKPPFWKCELPEKGTEKTSDEQLLPSWLAEKGLGIDPKLFEEEFNLAISGTGFGPLAHRIDSETSGLMLVVKTASAQRHLKSQFYATEISKRYVCLVHGRMVQDRGKVEAPIRTLRTSFTTRSEISTSGDWAETSFEVLARYEPRRRGVVGGPLEEGGSSPCAGSGYTLLACDIKSGRTHQIRVHMLHLGHPLVSDDKYLSADEVLADDRKWCPRLFLHSYRLQFRDLEQKDQLLVCPLPDDLRGAIVSVGAASANESASDWLFGETSWQREVFRPPLTQWRPGTQVLRKVVDMLSDGPMPLVQLNAEVPGLREAMENEGIAQINKAWLARHWAVFELAPDESAGELCVRLRPAHSVGDGSPENDLEKEIEAVMFQLEDLERQKQRAVAQEEFIRAAEVKRKVEAVRAELEKLTMLQDEDPLMRRMPGGSLSATERGTERQPPKAVAFRQDVRDEALFPSLPSALQRSVSVPKVRTVTSGSQQASGGVESQRSVGGGKMPRASSLTPSTAHSENPPTSESKSSTLTTKAVLADKLADVEGDGESRSKDVASPIPKATAKIKATEGRRDDGICLDNDGSLSLKDAVVKYLEVKGEAHINVLNNDKFLRSVMAAQTPRVMAINKMWMKKHEDTFSILRGQDGNMLVMLERPVGKIGNKSVKDALLLQAPKCPAYHQVIQRTCEDAPPIVYQYAAKERETAAKDNPTGDEGGETTGSPASNAPAAGSSLGSWQEKFLAALRQDPTRTCSADALISAVPSFAEAMGVRKPNETKELLMIFLKSCPDVFVVKKTFGSLRDYTVSVAGNK